MADVMRCRKGTLVASRRANACEPRLRSAELQRLKHCGSPRATHLIGVALPEPNLNACLPFDLVRFLARLGSVPAPLYDCEHVISRQVGNLVLHLRKEGRNDS